MESTEGKARTVWDYTWRALAALVALAAIVVACVALSGWMNRTVVTFSGGMGKAKDLGTVGQYFDAGSAVFSGIALLLVIGTTVMQRRELAMQRDALGKSHWELHRSAEADLQRLHIELVRMAMGDESLAEVWGEYRQDSPPERNRQYMYANLIFSHIFLNHQLGVVEDANIKGYIRIVAANPIFREYWAASAPNRALLNEASAERLFGQMIDEVLDEQPDPPDGLRAA